MPNLYQNGKAQRVVAEGDFKVPNASEAFKRGEHAAWRLVGKRKIGATPEQLKSARLTIERSALELAWSMPPRAADLVCHLVEFSILMQLNGPGGHGIDRAKQLLSLLRAVTLAERTVLESAPRLLAELNERTDLTPLQRRRVAANMRSRLKRVNDDIVRRNQGKRLASLRHYASAAPIVVAKPVVDRRTGNVTIEKPFVSVNAVSTEPTKRPPRKPYVMSDETREWRRKHMQRVGLERTAKITKALEALKAAEATIT